jgi:glycerol-3-phosphate acyltransferase PlsY
MIVLALLLSFFIGAIPFGVLIGKMRAAGSGNIGATNVWRVLGPKAGTAAFVLDVLKGVAGPLIARWLVPGNDIATALCAVCSVLGHNFSPFIGFKGGKGISTSLGALFGLMPWVALIDFAIWGVVLAVTRRVSVASMVVCITLPVLAFAWHEPAPNLIVAVFLGIMVFVKHLPNLKRIIAGTEPKIGQKKVEPVV